MVTYTQVSCREYSRVLFGATYTVIKHAQESATHTQEMCATDLIHCMSPLLE